MRRSRYDIPLLPKIMPDDFARCSSIETDTTAQFARHPYLRPIELLLGNPECRKYLTGLLFDSSDGDHHGFSPELSATSLALLAEHDRRFPQFTDA
jgi:hypothetical protein